MTLLERVAAVLTQRGTSHALIGAAALAVHGVSRSTLDQDLSRGTERAVDVVVGRHAWQRDVLARATAARSREIWASLRPRD